MTASLTGSILVVGLLVVGPAGPAAAVEWQPPVSLVTATGVRHVVSATNDSGEAVAAIVSVIAGTTRLEVVERLGGATTWSPPVRINEIVDVDRPVQIKMSNAGHVALIFYTPGSDILRFIWHEPGANWAMASMQRVGDMAQFNALSFDCELSDTGAFACLVVTRFSFGDRVVFYGRPSHIEDFSRSFVPPQDGVTNQHAPMLAQGGTGEYALGYHTDQGAVLGYLSGINGAPRAGLMEGQSILYGLAMGRTGAAVALLTSADGTELRPYGRRVENDFFVPRAKLTLAEPLRPDGDIVMWGESATMAYPLSGDRIFVAKLLGVDRLSSRLEPAPPLDGPANLKTVRLDREPSGGIVMSMISDRDVIGGRRSSSYPTTKRARVGALGDGGGSRRELLASVIADPARAFPRPQSISGDIDLEGDGWSVTMGRNGQIAATFPGALPGGPVQAWTVDGQGKGPVITSFVCPRAPIVGEPATYSVTATDASEPLTYEWDLDEGGTATGATVTHTYTQISGTNGVRLVVTDALGFSTTRGCISNPTRPLGPRPSSSPTPAATSTPSVPTVSAGPTTPPAVNAAPPAGSSSPSAGGGGASGQCSPGPLPVIAAPAISGFSLSPAAVKAGKSTTLEVKVSAPAWLSVTLDGRSSKQADAHRLRQYADRLAKLLDRSVGAGVTKLSLPTVIKELKLAPGRYRVTLVATNSAGLSRPISTTLRVK